MFDLTSAADSSFLKDDLLFTLNAAYKSANEAIGLIGIAVFASFISSTSNSSLPDSKTGFWKRGILSDGKILLFFPGGSELPTVFRNPPLLRLIFDSIAIPSWAHWHLEQRLHVEHDFTRHRHTDMLVRLIQVVY
jgi:hypothetical protein